MTDCLEAKATFSIGWPARLQFQCQGYSEELWRGYIQEKLSKSEKLSRLETINGSLRGRVLYGFLRC